MTRLPLSLLWLPALLAPAIAARVTCVQVTWDERTRAERQVLKPTAVQLRPIEVPDEVRDFLDDLNREAGA